MGALLGLCPSPHQNLSASLPHGTITSPRACAALTGVCSAMRDHIYFITASATDGFVALSVAQSIFCVPTLLFRSLWRCEFKSSQPSNAPKRVLVFKAPAVCIAAWLKLPFCRTSAFVSHISPQFRQRFGHGRDSRWLDALSQSEQLEAPHSSNSSSQAVCRRVCAFVAHRCTYFIQGPRLALLFLAA
jgi:hypothetical protein